MLRLIVGLGKFALAACIGLLAGNLIEWDGTTLAERVRAPLIRSWADKAAGKLEDTLRHAASGREVRVRRDGPAARDDEAHGISASERAKLRALIKELGKSKEGV